MQYFEFFNENMKFKNFWTNILEIISKFLFFKKLSKVIQKGSMRIKKIFLDRHYNK